MENMRDYENMTVAVCSEGSAPDAKMSLRTGRSPWFLIFKGKRFVKALKNPFAEGRGVAFKVASMLEKEGVKILVGSDFGDKMKNALESRGIETKVEDGFAKEIIEKMTRSFLIRRKKR